MADSQTPRQEFNTEDLKKLLRLGASALQHKVREVVSTVRHELNPDVRFARHLQNKYRALVAQGYSEEVAQKTVLEYAKELIAKTPVEKGE